MKKSTLLLGLAVMAGFGCAMAQDAQEPEMIRGIKITPDDAAPEARYYYSISNMRIQRLNYSTGDVAGFNEETGSADWEDIYMNDGGLKQVPLPLFLPDGYPADWMDGDLLEDYEGEEYTLTPQPYEYPNMGLATLNGKFWLAFSAQKEVMNPNTIYWYFTKGTGSSNVRIHNAVLDGTVDRNQSSVTDIAGATRGATGFSSTENNYYVVNLKEQLIEEFGEGAMALTDQQMDEAFALSKTSTIEPGGRNCMDVNNYIIYTREENRKNADGSDYLAETEDEEGNLVEAPVTLRYGFASAKAAEWSPLTSNGSNDNHLYNNGSLFFVSEQPAADALAAIEAYKQVVIDTYKEGAIEGAKAAYVNVTGLLKGWLNVPALWKDQTTLNAIIAECESYDGGNAESVVDLATQEAYIAAAVARANQKLVKAAGLVGTGAVVTFQNQLALRDVADAEDLADEYQLGNAYISADMDAYYNNSGMNLTEEYKGIGPVLEANDNCKWELIPVAGTTNFYLYNAATETYIRKYTGMIDLAGGVDMVGEGANNFTWATTSDVNEAAPFTFVGCADVDEQNPLSEEDQIIVEDWEISTDVTNNVYLRSTIVETTVNEETGETTENTVDTYIHRASGAHDYQFVNYGFENNRWYANSNIFKIDVLVEGGIDEIEAAETAKATGIYDLQGRKVAKAGKGLYIINGVKTIVR